jgi:hypothetical protein
MFSVIYPSPILQHPVPCVYLNYSNFSADISWLAYAFKWTYKCLAMNMFKDK